MRQLSLLLLMLLTITAWGQTTKYVTSTSDDGYNTLRRAIEEANADEGTDYIFDLTSLNGTITLQSHLDTIKGNVVIKGPGEDKLTISGNDQFRIFFIKSDGNVSISDLTLAHGLAKGGDGESVWGGGGGGAGMGGAIFLEAGNLDLSFVTLSDNSAIGGNGGRYAPNSRGRGAIGGAGPFGVTPYVSYGSGKNGVFGSGGGGAPNPSKNEINNGGDGGYGAGGGTGWEFSDPNTAGDGGKFGGDAHTGGSYTELYAGGGAGLGAAIFIYGGGATFNAVTVTHNTAVAGVRGGVNSAAQDGQAKAAGVFHYSGSLVNNGLVLDGNMAADAGTIGTDNVDFYSETGLSLSESNPPVIAKANPVDGESSYQKSSPIAFVMNENIYKTDGSEIAVSDLASIITFKETNASGADLAFTATLDINKFAITPTNELQNGQTYYIAISNLEDRYGNEMSAPQTVTFTADGTAPVFTENPASGSTLLGTSLTFRADEPIFKTDGAAIEAADFIDLVKVRLDDASGALVSTTVFLTGGNTLNVELDESLPSQTYHVTLQDIADVNGNVITPFTATYTRPAFADAKLRVKNILDGGEFTERLVELVFDEEYYIEYRTDNFQKLSSYFGSDGDKIFTLKEGDKNGADVGFENFQNYDRDRYFFLPYLAPNKQYYLKISNLYTADQTPLNPVELTFTTPNRFNPVLGSGYASDATVMYLPNSSVGTAFTLEYFINPTNTIRTAGLFYGRSEDNTSGLMMYLRNGELRVSKVDNTLTEITGQFLEADITLPADDYTSLTFTYDNGTAKLYHDGTEVASGTLDLPVLETVEIKTNRSITGDFGSLSLSSGYPLFDEVRVWDVALSQSEIADYQSQHVDFDHPSFENLKHLWHFDEELGSDCFDAVTLTTNVSSNDRRDRLLSNRLSAPELSLSLDGTEVSAGDAITFLAGNGGQVIKTFEITNSGTQTLEILTTPAVFNFPGRYAIDFSESDTLLAAGESTSFTVTFQSSDVRSYPDVLRIANTSPESVFEIHLTGRGVSIANGIWDYYGGRDVMDDLYGIAAYNGELNIVYANSGWKLAKAKEAADGSLEITNVQNLSQYTQQATELITDGNGNFYNHYASSNTLNVYNVIAGTRQTYTLNSNTTDYSEGDIALDNNGVFYSARSYYDGSADNQHGIKIDKGFPSTETITLTFEEFETLYGQNGGSYLSSYSIAFDSDNNLYLATASDYGYFMFLKYDGTNGWQDLGFDTKSGRGISRPDLVIDQQDNLHVLNVNSNSIQYHKLSRDGELLEYGYTDNTYNAFGYNFYDFYPNRLGVGPAGEPIMVVKPNKTEGLAVLTYENGDFRYFNDKYISGDEIEGTQASDLRVSVDPITGRPFVSASFVNSLYTIYSTQPLAPELSVTIDADATANGDYKTFRTGVGTTQTYTLQLTNSGLIDLPLGGENTLTIKGDNAEAISFNKEAIPSRLTVDQTIEVELIFEPKGVFKNEATISISHGASSDPFVINLQIESLDADNTGEWTEYATLSNPIYTDADMAIGINGALVYSYNTYEAVNYSGTLYPYAQFRLYDGRYGELTQTPTKVTDGSVPTSSPSLTSYYTGQQVLVNPMGTNAFTYVDPDRGNYPFRMGYNANGFSAIKIVHDGRPGVTDLEYGDDGDLVEFKLFDDSGGDYLQLRNDNNNYYLYQIWTYSDANLDVELGDGTVYLAYQYNNSLRVMSQTKNSGTLNTISQPGSSYPNPGSPYSHSMDIELGGDTIFIAYIDWSRKDLALLPVHTQNGTHYSVPFPGLTGVSDIQVHVADGIQYVSVIEDLGNGQYPVSVLKYVNDAWEYVGTPRFSYGAYETAYSSLADAPTKPALRAPFVRDEYGTLYVMYGDKIFSLTETPAEFNHLPAFTSDAITSVDEGVAYSYNITTSDVDVADVLTITSSDLPDWLTLTDNGDGTATLSGTPTDADALEYEIELTVSDGKAMIKQSFTLTVNDLNSVPAFDQPVTTISIDQDAEAQNLDLMGITDGDVHLDQSLSFEVTSDNTDLISEMSGFISDIEAGTGSLFFQPNIGESGVANLTITLSDDGTPVQSVSYSIEVTVNATAIPDAILVTNLNDSGDGSLRAAIEAANADADHDVIDMRGVAGTINLASSLPVISSNMDIIGLKEIPVIVDGGSTHQVFFIETNVIMKGFSIVNGYNKGGDGGLGDAGGGGGAGFGAAIFINDGNVVLDNMTFNNNQVVGGSGGAGTGGVNGFGGSSIFGDGGTTGARHPTFTGPAIGGGDGLVFGTGGGAGGAGFNGYAGGNGGNGNFGGGSGGSGFSSGGTAGVPGTPGEFGGTGGFHPTTRSGGGGGAGLGGAIFARQGNLIISNSTFASNSATKGTGGTGGNFTANGEDGQGKGGAIFINQGVGYTASNNTFSGNTASNSFNNAGVDDNDVYVGSTTAASSISLSNESADEFLDGANEVLIADISVYNTNPVFLPSFELEDGYGDNSAFSIIGDSLMLGATTVLDFETKDAYSIRIKATTATGISTSDFTISVNGLDDPATDFDLISMNIDEGQPAGTAVGTFSVTDVDGGANVFTLTDGHGDNASFQISEDKLQVAEVFDFDDKSSYSIQVELGDISKQFTITVNNINTAPTGITIDNSSIPENKIMEYLVGTLSAIDQDDDDSFIYQLVASNSAETDDFKILGDQLYTKTAHDFETEGTFDVAIRVFDSQNQSVEQTLTITITDDNDVPTNLQLSATAIEENTVAGSVVGTLSVDDQDAADTHTYSLESGFEDNWAFVIDGDQLKTFMPFDFEAKPSWSIKVAASDGNGGNIEKEMTITISDINDAPTDIALSATEIDENTATGTAIGTLSVTDEDAGDSHTFSLVSGFGDNASFAISGAEISNAETFDFETKSSYNIKVSVVDQNGETFEKEFTITVNDVNEAPTEIGLSSSEIDENADAGSLIATLSATDEDTGEQHIFTLVEGFGDNASFAVSANELSSAQVFDFETESTYSIKLMVDDQNGSTYEQEFTIAVNDVNDAPSDIAMDITNIDENVPVGTLIGNISTTDQDAGDTHTYAVLTEIPYDGSLYAPVSVTDGQVFTAVPVDYEVLSSIDIEFKSTDVRGLFVTKTITLTVNDISTTNDGTGSADWNDPTSWESGQLPDENTDVTLPADFTIVIDDIQKVKNLKVGKNTTVDIANGGALAIYGSFSGEGDVNQTREITGTSLGGYSIVGSPMVETPDVSTFPIVVYEYDGVEGFTAMSSGSLQPGVGYFLRESFPDGSPLDLALGGEPNTGDVTVNVSSEGNGYHLLSNPYTAAISVVDFIDGNPALEGTLYLWDDGGANVGADGTRAGDYLAVNKMGIAGTFNNGGASGGTGSAGEFDMNIGSLQGFFAEALTDGTVTFDQDMQVTTSASNAVFFRIAEEVNPNLPQTVKLTLQNEQYKNTIVVGLSAFATDGHDRGYDSKKFEGNENIAFYSLMEEQRYAIQGLPLSNGETVSAPLGFELSEVGAYEIKVAETMNLPSSMEVTLIDTWTGEAINLLENSTYNFTANQALNDGRFELVFLEKETILESAIARQLVVYGDESALNIKYPTDQQEQVKIYSLDGKLVFEEAVSFYHDQAQIHPQLQTRKVYILQMAGQNIKFILK